MSSTPSPAKRPARLPGLDGLRAVAVVAVLLYHGEFGWAKGGYLGVDLFFVLSGFLISGLLIGETKRTGTVSLRDFWVRRIRRLVPAQITLLVSLLVFVFIFHRAELYEFRGQAIATLFGVVNWFMIATGQSYFTAIGRPPALRHLWSLAIEMQFYLVWPVVFGLLLKAFGRRLTTLVSVLIGGALFSSVLMVVLYRADDPSTAYYSTFTRLTGLLLGAALAVVWRPDRLADAPIAESGRILDRIGVGALVVSLVFYGFVSDQSVWTYRLGFLVFAILSAVLVAVASHPTATLAGPRGFGHPVLVAIGARSYGLYLWHWPVFAYSWPGIDTELGRVPLFILRMAITIVLNELCFRYVEIPWYQRRRSLQNLRTWFSRPRPGEVLRPVAVGLGSLLVLIAIGFTAVAPVHKDEIVSDIEQGREAIEARQEAAPPPPTRDETTTTEGETATTTTTTEAEKNPDGTEKIPDFGVDGELPYVTAIGDSVMIGSAEALYERFGDRIYIDGEVGRQATDVTPVIEAIQAQRGLGDVLLVHIGTNGTFEPDQINSVIDAADGVPVVFVNARADRPWVPSVNENLATVTAERDDAYLIDWNGYSNSNSDWYGHDGVHLTIEGMNGYADLIRTALTGGGVG